MFHNTVMPAVIRMMHAGTVLSPDARQMTVGRRGCDLRDLATTLMRQHYSIKYWCSRQITENNRRRGAGD